MELLELLGCKSCCVVLILVPLLCCAMIACVAIYVSTEGPEPPLSANFKPQAAEAQAFDNAVQGAARDAGMNGWFAIQFTERELSSWLALEGEEFAEKNGETFPFEDVQVEIDNGEMQVYGELSRSGVTFPMTMVIEPKVDDESKLDLEVKSMDAGGVHLPGALFGPLVSLLEDAITKTLEDLPGSYYLYGESLFVDEGTFAVQGYVQ